MYYTEKGQGEPLILLHGNGEDSSIFDKFGDKFAEKYRVIAIDTRGHGKSPMGEEPFSIYQFAEDLNEFMEMKGIEKANILGFSDGGNIAMIFASRHPEKVIKLIANGANTKPSGMKNGIHLAMWLMYFVYSVLGIFSEKYRMKKLLFSLMLFEPKLTSEELESITVPTLVLVGTDDLIKEKESRYIAKTIPDAELCFVLGGHMIIKENLKDYSYAVEKFLIK
ncbi:MAG: alpha/beta hydrolase [Oscillospiraceae bacterium]|nr:alpha/beta hydrolase [Oscillospiraceae bacterium]